MHTWERFWYRIGLVIGGVIATGRRAGRFRLAGADLPEVRDWPRPAGH
jgi:hypothetical protein